MLHIELHSNMISDRVQRSLPGEAAFFVSSDTYETVLRVGKALLKFNTHIEFTSQTLGKSTYVGKCVCHRNLKKFRPQISEKSFSRRHEATAQDGSRIPAGIMEAVLCKLDSIKGVIGLRSGLVRNEGIIAHLA